MIRRVMLSGALCLAAPATAHAQERVESLVYNVVHVQAARGGFGFIVGVRPGGLLIATARHTLADDWDAKPQVCFPPRGDPCLTAEVAYWADAIGNQPALDLVILAVADPGGLAWRPDVESSGSVGEDVRVIGRSGQWWVSPEPGRISGVVADSMLLRYRGVALAPGVSGSPIIDQDGIVAMHLQEARSEGEASGLQLAAIRERVVERAGGAWALLPKAKCEGVSMQVRALDGLTVLVHIDPRRPGAALDAMAALHCVGARAMPRLLNESTPWGGDAVIYRSGELRNGRSLQMLLAPTRVDTRLGEPAYDLELWVR